MSDRNGFQPGVPSWVDVLGDDPESLGDFYRRLFGWELTAPGTMPGGGDYYVATLRGREAAGIGSLAASGAPYASWTTYVEVADVDASAEQARAAGATVVAEPFDAGPGGRIAVLVDPWGAAFGIWKPTDRLGAEVVNEPGAWAMSALQSPDPEAACTFYGDLFGWEYDAFATGPATVYLCRLPGFVGGEPSQPVPRDVVAAIAGLDEPRAMPCWQVDFWVDDLDRVVAATSDGGGAVLEPPSATPPFRRALVADPAGARFTVSQLVAAPS